jgi:hypothetical protein
MQNEVHQGSAISPALFDIYKEEYLQEIKKKFKEYLFYLRYADDYCFICKTENLEKLINILFEESGQFNLNINPPKSGFFRIHNHNFSIHHRLIKLEE